ncbi:hypothetical protein RB597_005795 [Gaeumannomyces tritici]
MAASHPTLTTPYEERAKTAGHPLSSYLLRLMELKASNLCLSADATNARELLQLADKVGPSIVVFKTHYDLVAGWDYNPQTGTGARLAALARRHGFLIFEDRKFADIGKTVQLQYTGGTARIVEWAHIVNVNIQAGKEVVRAMAEAAAHWRERIKYEVRTSVTVGTPISDSFDEDQDEEVSPTTTGRSQQTPTLAQRRQTSPHHESAAAKARKNSGQSGLAVGAVPIPQPYCRDSVDGRKGSIVSITTVTQSYEPANSPRLSKSMAEGGIDDVVFPGIEEAPLERGLLILAQMSTGGCLMTPEYTQACIEAARDNKGFTMGFVAQQALNSDPDDSFIHMTPGCKLPPEGDDDEDDGELEGDGLDQQYNTPSLLIGDKGTDIVIVGRGIIKAGDPQSEAERYRRIAWKAYLARLPQP